MYSRSHFHTQKQNFVTVTDLDEGRETSLRHAAALLTVGSGEGYVTCHYLEFVLVQEEANVLCNSKCCNSILCKTSKHDSVL
jgi:hypothetical protein